MFRASGVICASYGVAQGKEEAVGPHTYQRSAGAHERSRGGVPTHACSTLRHPVPFCHFFSHRGMLTCVRSLVTQARAQSGYR